MDSDTFATGELNLVPIIVNNANIGRSFPAYAAPEGLVPGQALRVPFFTRRVAENVVAWVDRVAQTQHEAGEQPVVLATWDGAVLALGELVPDEQDGDDPGRTLRRVEPNAHGLYAIGGPAWDWAWSPAGDTSPDDLPINRPEDTLLGTTLHFVDDHGTPGFGTVVRFWLGYASWQHDKREKLLLLRTDDDRTHVRHREDFVPDQDRRARRLTVLLTALTDPRATDLSPASTSTLLDAARVVDPDELGYRAPLGALLGCERLLTATEETGTDAVLRSVLADAVTVLADLLADYESGHTVAPADLADGDLVYRYVLLGTRGRDTTDRVRQVLTVRAEGGAVVLVDPDGTAHPAVPSNIAGRHPAICPPPRPDSPPAPPL